MGKSSQLYVSVFRSLDHGPGPLPERFRRVNGVERPLVIGMRGKDRAGESAADALAVVPAGVEGGRVGGRRRGDGLIDVGYAR